MAESPQYIKLSYYSKSKNFLYPILGYKRNETYKCQSFLFFHQHSVLNGELITLFPNNGDALYHNYEANSIAPHPLLRGCYEVPGASVYIFDISGYSDDIQHFLCGEYSKFSKSLKKKILIYMDDSIDVTTPAPGRFNHAVLFPELYRKLVAEELGVNVKNLTELAPIYDSDKETLDIENFQICGYTTMDTHSPI